MMSAALIVGIIVFILGSVMCIFGYKILSTAKASQSWPCVMGRVIESTLVEKPNSTSAKYAAKVAYEYVVSGVTQTATRITFGDHDSRNFTNEKASATVASYPNGKTVQVYYDSNNVGSAVLVPGTSSNVYTTLRIGIVLMLVGIGFIYWATL
jgi:Protein of unknown function (DUF3592)